MGDFEIIETGFSSADETINFGTRSIGLGSLYEISTIGCFKSYEDESGVPSVTINCLIENGQLVLATDKSLKIFDDTKLSNLLFTAAFDSSIVSITVSPDNNFMLICLESGVVNVFHVKDRGEIFSVFTKCLPSTTEAPTIYIEGFFESQCSKVTTFIIVQGTGAIFRVFVSTKPVDQSENTFETRFEELLSLKTHITSASFSYPILLTNGAEFSVINTETQLVLSDNSHEVKTMFSLGRKILALDFQGNLFRICSLSMIIFPVEYDILLEDILVISDHKKSHIFAVTKPNETGETFLQLLDTDFSQIFSLKITHPVYLIPVNSATDDLLFISKVMKNDVITELRLQSVYETEPELRLTRLIRRQRFEEAEKFAKSFNINPVVILKARAQLIVDKSECTFQDISNLIKLMDSIHDEYFKLQCCSNVDCGKFDDVRKILTYGAKISVKNDGTSQNMKRVLTDLLFRFDTFTAILKPEDDIQSWYKFSTCNMIEELKVYLKNYEIEEAILIYSRMDQKSIDDLTEDYVQEILAILNDLPMNVYQPFLPTFIPITITHLPTCLSIFVKWLYGKIFFLEKRDKLNFPQSGITLAENVLKLLKVEKNSLSFQRQCTLNKRSIEDLSKLIDALKILLRLKKQFRIDVNLSDYFEGPEYLIHTLLTSNMTPEDYDDFLEQFLYNYMLQNDFDPDEIFLDEIKILLKYDDCWVSIIEAILKHISSVKIKLEATKEILESSQVPWCDIVRKIALDALQHSHPLVQDVETILKNEQRLIVMRNPKYKIKERQINNYRELEYIIRKIIYANEPTLVKDVYHLCKSAEDRCRANFILIEHFILTRNLDEAMTVLDKNGRDEIYACTKTLVLSAEITINNKFCKQELKDNYYKALSMLFDRLLKSCQDGIERKKLEESFCKIRGVYKINKFFQRSLTTNDLMSSSRKLSILDDLIEEIAENVKEGSWKIENMLMDADRLALWFSVDKDKLLIDLCEKVGNFEVVLKIAEHLYETDSDSANLCRIALLFLKYLGSQISSLPGESFDESLLMTTIAPDMTRCINDGQESDVFLRGLKFSRDVFTKALCKAQRQDLPFLSEVMCWVKSCFYLTCQESILQKQLFGKVFNPKQTAPSFTVLNSIRNYFQTYVGYIEKLKGSNRMYLSSLNSNIPQVMQEQLQHEISSLPTIIDTFCREGQYLTGFSLLKTIGSAFILLGPKELNIVEQVRLVMVSKCLPQLLHVVVSAENVDTNLMYNLLLATQKAYLKYIHHYLKTYKRQPKKLRDISIVGIKLLDLYGETTGRDVMVDAAITCKWWSKLKGVRAKIPYDEFFKAKADSRLKWLIGLDVVDVPSIKTYCEDFRLDVEYYYKEFLKGCLINWKPKYEISSNLDGKKSLIMLNDEHSLLSKCQEIINELKDKNAVFAMMEKILKVKKEKFEKQEFKLAACLLTNKIDRVYSGVAKC